MAAQLSLLLLLRCTPTPGTPAVGRSGRGDASAEADSLDCGPGEGTSTLNDELRRKKVDAERLIVGSPPPLLLLFSVEGARPVLCSSIAVGDARPQDAPDEPPELPLLQPPPLLLSQREMLIMSSLRDGMRRRAARRGADLTSGVKLILLLLLLLLLGTDETVEGGRRKCSALAGGNDGEADSDSGDAGRGEFIGETSCSFRASQCFAYAAAGSSPWQTGRT